MIVPFKLLCFSITCFAIVFLCISIFFYSFVFTFLCSNGALVSNLLGLEQGRAWLRPSRAMAPTAQCIFRLLNSELFLLFVSN
jgi:hypothetical protein